MIKLLMIIFCGLFINSCFADQNSNVPQNNNQLSPIPLIPLDTSAVIVSPAPQSARDILRQNNDQAIQQFKKAQQSLKSEKKIATEIPRQVTSTPTAQPDVADNNLAQPSVRYF